MIGGHINVQCVGCQAIRKLTFIEAAKGQPFCPVCMLPEVAVSASIKLTNDGNVTGRKKQVTNRRPKP